MWGLVLVISHASSKKYRDVFTSYLAEYRIHRAKYILGTELVPMAEVAARSGFSSVKTFHHVFKSMVGTSPMKFQKIFSAFTK